MKISSRVANYIEKSPRVQNALLSVNKNTALFNAGYTTILAVTLKPAAILGLAVNTDDGKRDAKYAAVKSITTGILDFAIALALFIPMNKYLSSIGSKLFDTKASIYFQDKAMCNNYKSVMNRFVKILTLPIFAVLKFGAIQPCINIMEKRRAFENSNK